jgi:hypothetical protein
LKYIYWWQRLQLGVHVPSVGAAHPSDQSSVCNDASPLDSGFYYRILL